MALFIDPSTGKQYDVPAGEEENARTQFGLVSAEEQAAQSAAEGANVQTVAEEAGRAVASGAAGVARAVLPETPGGLTELEPGQVDRTGSGRALASNVGLEGLYDEEALRRREANPIAAGIGSGLPGAVLTAPLPLIGGILGEAGVSGYFQEAVDAELESRDIDGALVLRNGAINAAWGLGAVGLGAGARAALRGGKNVLERSAEAIRQTHKTRAAVAEGEELVDAASDPAVRDELLSTLANRSEEAVAKAMTRLEQTRPAKVANNPNAQRDAIETMADAFEQSDKAIADELRGLMKGSPTKRLQGLQALRQRLDDGTEVANALDNTLGNAALWGDDALGAASALERALKLRPQPGATPESLLEFASAVRDVRGGEFAGLADQIEQLAERASEVRVAATLGGAPEAGAKAAKGVDYAAAMKNMDPEEAWQLTRGGADEGLRKLEANTVSDALQRVDGVLKEDVAMVVKRDDFVAGAGKWSPAQIAKQDEFAGRVFDKGAELLDLVSKSKGSNPESGYALGGFAAAAERALNTSLSRIAGADPITRNFELDQLKRTLDSITDNLAKSTNVDQATKAFGVARLGEVTNELRSGLESFELFGRNAGLQEATNAAWKKLIDPYKRVKRRMSEFLGREFANVGTESGNIIRYNPDMVERAMAAYDRNFRADLQGAIAGIDEMVTARQAQGLSHLDSLSQARADLERIREGFEFADLLRVAKAQAKEPALESAKRSAGKAVGAGAGTAAGAVVGGPVGAVVGAGAGGVVGRLVDDVMDARSAAAGILKPGSSSPLNTALRRHLGLARNEQATLLSDPAFAGALPESLKRQLMAQGDGAGQRAVKLADQAKKAADADRKLTARMLVSPKAAKRYARLVGSTAAAVTRFQGEHDSPHQAFVAYRKMLDDFAREPEKMLSMLQEEFGDVEQLSPKLQREMLQQAMRVHDYLQRHMPGQRNRSVVYPHGTPPSRMEVRQFALRFTAATDPASVFEDAKAGRLQKVQLDTLQELWPREYEALRAEVLVALGSGQATTRSRQLMSLLFDFGSGVDPALGARTRRIVAAARKEQGATQQPAASPPTSSTMPSAQSLQPGGMAALNLGAQLTF
jgi:hypothetical protein